MPVRSDRIRGGALLVGLGALAAFALPRLASKGRKAVRQATGTTHRSGVSRPGTRATADPARGMPA